MRENQNPKMWPKLKKNNMEMFNVELRAILH